MFHFVQLVDKNQDIVKRGKKIEMKTVKLKTKAFHNVLLLIYRDIQKCTLPDSSIRKNF